MSASNQVEIEARIRNEAALKAVNELSDSITKGLREAAENGKNAIGDLGESMTSNIVAALSVTGLIEKGFGLVKDAIAGTVDFLKESVKAAEEAEAQEIRLTRLLELRGVKVDEVKAKLAAFNEQIARNTAIEDDALVAIETQLTALGVLPQDLERVTRAVIGFSERYGVDLTQATQTVGTAVVDNADKLRKYGIDTKNVSAAINELARSSVLAADSAQTFGGKTQSLSNAWGDFSKAVGSLITQSDLAKSFLDTLRSGVNLLTDAVKAGQGFLDKYSGALKAAAKGALSAIPGVGVVVAGADLASAIGGTGESPQDFRQRKIDEHNEAIGSLFVGPEAPLATQNRKDTEEAERARKEAQKKLAEHEKEVQRLMAASLEKIRKLQEEEYAAQREDDAIQMAYEDALSKTRYNRRKRDVDVMNSFQKQVDTIDTLEYEKKLEISQLNARLDEENLQRRIDISESQARIAEDQAKIEEGFWSQSLGFATQGATGIVSALATAAATGEKISWGGVFGNLLTTIGSAAVSLGSLAILAGALGTASPFFAGVTGGPLTVVAGAALVAGGLAAIAAGTYIGAKASKRPATATGASTGFSSAGGGGGSSFSTGFTPSASAGQPTTTVINVSLATSGAAIVGSSAEVGRWIGRQLQASERLNLSGVRYSPARGG